MRNEMRNMRKIASNYDIVCCYQDTSPNKKGDDFGHPLFLYLFIFSE